MDGQIDRQMDRAGQRDREIVERQDREKCIDRQMNRLTEMDRQIDGSIDGQIER